MARELKSVVIEFVSLVDKAANKKKFLLVKNVDATDNSVTKSMEIIKGVDEEQRLVYGVVYEPNVVDAHGDFMTAEEIVKAAHYFMENFQKVDANHDFEEGKGKLVECFVAPADMEINGNTITKGTWSVGIHVTDDETWNLIKSGEITGLSMAGYAGEVVEKTEKDSLLDSFKKFLGIKKDFNTELENSMNTYNVLSILDNTVNSIDWSLESEERRDEVIKNFKQAITFVEKNKVEDMTREETIEIVKGIISEINIEEEVKKSIPSNEAMEAKIAELVQKNEALTELVNELSKNIVKGDTPKQATVEKAEDELVIDMYV